MKTFIKFMFCHASDKSNILLLLGVLLLLMVSCETEYIPDYSEEEVTAALATEGNFTLNIGFANFGAQDSTLNFGTADSLSTTRRMEADTSVFKVDDDLSIYTTLTEDPVSSAPAVKTKAFTTGAKIRVLAYAVTGSPTPTYTKAFDEEYSFGSSKLNRSSGTGNIMLPQGTYKFIAYSYNNSTTPISPLLNIDTIIPDIDPVNDLIWGESVPTTVFDGPPLDTVYIKMVHKLSQIKLVAATPQDATPSITAFSNVTMPGYYFDLETFNGAITQKGHVQQTFDFPTLPATPADTVKATPRTVYTGTPGDMPTIISIGSMTVNSKTVTDFKATFAKSLKSGYSYTMTMRIGNAINLPSDATHPDYTPAGMFTYVGAFWQHDQTGERLIRVPRLANGLMDSVWTAQVIEGRDWILLDKVMTTDPNVWNVANEASVQNGNDPNFEANNDRQLTFSPTASTFVSGMLLPSGSDNQIYFRIGLRDHYQPSIVAPARYGLVLLTYGNNKYRQRIWIRQGEDADYLMRPGDPNGAGNAVTGNRSRAAKFSPYNLTDPNKNTATTYNTVPNLGTKGGDFVDYPSKAGYHFQWNGNTKAFHPTNTISGWTTRTGTTWDVIYETCPNGYRRFTDTYTTAGNSEIRNSLWVSNVVDTKENMTTNLENVLYGYYADGYFDRRQINPAIVGPTTTYDLTLPRAVATPGAEVAYLGMLFYNKYNNASLFFPATGFRVSSATATNGRLDQPGSSGHNWSRTYISGGNGPMQLAFDVDSKVSHTSFLDPDQGLAIRCVVDTTSAFPPIPSYDSQPNGFIPYVGAFWKANQTGERLIRMTTTAADVGAWTAYVLVGQDWIDVDATMTSDVNVGWRTDVTPNENLVDDYSVAGFDSRHPVAVTNSINGTTTTANPTIYFRIGLSSANLGAAPRYGMVLLQYANKTKFQRIWIRQGEMDDWTPGTASGTKWSPYNLGGANNFVSYPTQAGYFYQWVSPTPYDPVNPLGPVTGWSTNDSDPFNIGSATPSITYVVPSQANVQDLLSEEFTMGYYADGYFDRRKITNSITYGNEPGGSSPSAPFDKTAVSAQTSNVGYVGVLVFSHTNDASLFFPAAGYRYGLPKTGDLGWTGRLGNYWTTSRDPILSSTEEFFFDITDPNIYVLHNFLSINSTYGCSVRCIVAP